MADASVPDDGTAVTSTRAPNALPSISQDTTVKTVSGPSIASEMRGSDGAFQGLAELGNQFQAIAEKHDIQNASQAGGAAVTRDADGNLQIQGGLHDGAFPTGQAYNHAAVTAYAAQSTGDRRVAFQKLADQYEGDPEGFQKNAEAWVTGQVAKAPGIIQNDLRNTGMEEADQFAAGLVAAKRQKDIKAQYGDVQSNITRGWNDLFALAKNGGTDTAAFASARAQVLNQYDALKNPVFGIGKDEINNEIDERSSMAEGYALMGHLIRTYQSEGVQPALKELSVFDDPKYNLSEENRMHFRSETRSQILEADAVNKSANEDQKRVVEGMLGDAQSAAEHGGTWSNIVTPDAIKKAYGPRAYEIIGNLDAGAQFYSFTKQLKDASPDQIAGLLAGLDPSKHPGAQGGFDNFYSKYLAGQEGGYTASDGNGHPAAFGINQGANPDVDVANLTPDKAKQLLHNRYWQPSGADNMPADLAAVHGDTAINMGVGAAKDLLKQSGGDVNKYLALREQRYRDIAANNPDKAGQLPGWLDRNAAVGAYASTVSGQPGSAGFKEQEKLYTAAVKAVTERQKALAEDPAAYVQASRPDVAVPASNDPATVQNSVRGSLALQRQMGVMAPTILPKAAAAQIIAKFSSPDPTKPADDMNSQIDGLAQEYGSYFPQVMSELQKHGMPPEAASLYQVRGLGVPAVRMATAINSMSHMGKDLNAGRDAFFSGAPNNSEIRKALPGVMGDYADSFVGNPEGPAQVAAMSNAASLYSRQLAYEGVSDPNRAAQQAHDDLVGSRYNFVDSYRVPKGVDQSMIQSGANAIRNNLSAANLEPYANAAPGVSLNDRRAMSARILSGQGKWVTRSDDKGLSLVWPQQTGYLPALDAGGKPISLSWTQLQQAGQSRKITADDAVSGYQAGGGN